MALGVFAVSAGALSIPKLEMVESAEEFAFSSISAGIALQELTDPEAEEIFALYKV